jgi:hypothetical protein
MHDLVFLIRIELNHVFISLTSPLRPVHDMEATLVLKLTSWNFCLHYFLSLISHSDLVLDFLDIISALCLYLPHFWRKVALRLVF